MIVKEKVKWETPELVEFPKVAYGSEIDCSCKSGNSDHKRTE